MRTMVCSFCLLVTGMGFGAGGPKTVWRFRTQYRPHGLA